MKVAAGGVAYNQGIPPCTGIGLVWTEEELCEGIDGRVKEVLFDDDGKAQIEDIFSGQDDTGFVQDALRQVLNDPGYIEDWRVGEAIAEAYLVAHRDCIFPWPVIRDVRKSGSSLPGADLVGLGTDAGGYCLAFGETKTSGQAKYPPSVMYGPKGLKRQLEDLRDNKRIRTDLFRYLAFRSIEASWKQHFEAAGERYLKNSSDVMLFGMLVRDVPPNGDDLRARVHKLSENCPNGTRIELIAIYLPDGCIDGLGKAALAKRN